MKRIYHRIRHGHWPDTIRWTWSGDATDPMCRTCVIDAYRADQRDEERRVPPVGF